MEALRKAVSSNSKKKHTKLEDDWGENKEPVEEGMTFHLKYLGSALVEDLGDDCDSYGDRISSKAIKTVVAMAKASGKKLTDMAIKISPDGICVSEVFSRQIKTDMDIRRICFCTADKNNEKVFAYIARNTENETMECHAFLTTKRKIAEAVALTVGQAFTIAKEQHDARLAKKLRETQTTTSMASTATDSRANADRCEPSQVDCRLTTDRPATGDNVLGFDDNFSDMDCFRTSPPGGCSVNQWQCAPSAASSTTHDPPVGNLLLL